MKRIFTLLFLVLISFNILADVVEKTYSFTNPKIKQTGTRQLILFDNTRLSGIPGEPLLPYAAVNLLIPPGQEAVTISFEGYDLTIVPGTFRLVPGQYSRPLSDPGMEVMAENEAVYSSREQYPSRATGHLSTQYMNGYGFAQSVFTPITYIPATGEIGYYKRVVIRIVTRDSQRGADALQNLTSSGRLKQACIRNAQNPEVADAYPVRRATGNEYQLLIITTADYEDQFDLLRQLYLPRGMKTQVATTAFIQSNISGADLPEKMRNYIIQQYQQNGIEHVLLGGDVELVPYRGFYCHVQSSSVYEDDNIPSDLYFSALDGNWNTNGNSLWGEIGEDDLLPEVSVGRMSFSNSTELAAMLNKTITYQNDPVTGELRNPLLAGENLYYNPDTWGSDYLELLIGTHNDNGYTTTGIPETHNIQRLYDEDGEWSKTDLMNAINAGRNFVHHVGHANDSYVMKFSTWDITNQNFAGVNGITHNFPVVYTHGCICGAFDVNDCIAEKMVSIENFASAFIGNSRYGWFNEGQTEGPSAHLHREFVDAMFTDSLNRAGRAHSESKAATSPWVNAPGQWEEGALRWCFYDCNVLGDPAMAIWTDEPLSISTEYPQSLTTGTPQFEVSVTTGGNPAKGLTAALLMNGILYGTGTTNSSGVATINLDPLVTIPGEAQLVISGYNCLPTYYPVTFVSGQTAYIVYQSYTLNDSQGNNNGQADYGETESISLTLQNLGLAEAQNVVATISSEDPYVSITDATENYGSIAAGGSATVENGFSFQISDQVPDNYPLVFTLTAVAGDTWLSEFQVVAFAPVLEPGTAQVDDGAGNGIPDPGETFNLTVPLINRGHSESLPLTASLSCSSSYINGTQWTAPEVTVDALSQAEVSFGSIVADNQTPIGTPVSFILTVTQGSPATVVMEHEYIFVIGQVSEDFETGDFSQHPWEQGGTTPWTISTENPYEGTFCARSGSITDNQSSSLTVTYEVLADDSIRFWHKVSSETDYDFLRFYVDNNKKDEWSGEQGWSYSAYPVTAGTHIFKWTYEKDISISSGEDAAWIDNIVFPPVDIISGMNIHPNNLPRFAVYPNPASGRLFIESGLLSTTPATLTLLEPTGKILLIKSGNFPNGLSELNISSFKPGMYILKITEGSFSQTQKLIIY